MSSGSSFLKYKKNMRLESLNFPINPFFIISFSFFLFYIFCIYTKVYKNLSVKYYQGNRERLPKKPYERHQNLSKEKKGKKWQYGHDCYKNLSEDENNKPVEYRKKYIMRKSTLFSTLWNCF